jgi:hypothetical protein
MFFGLSLVDSGAITSFSFANAVQSSKYTYQKMADTSSSFNSFGLPAINNAGTVAFSANTDAASGAYTSTGKTITAIAGHPNTTNPALEKFLQMVRESRNNNSPLSTHFQ